MKQRRRPPQKPAPIRAVDPRELARAVAGELPAIVEPPPNTDAKVWQDDWLAPI